ncbi:MAG: reverse transcriptase/maturase family protein [Planctomycetota bacterium]|nr:reverse transcriptase/maturase family protein [Planctomycetota bacterium]
MISAAPYRDRVVHHLLMNVLEPIFDRHMHPDSYACRRGKGTHAASDRLQALMRRHSHFVQCDVVKFFPSIDHAILKGQYRRLIKDRNILRLLDLIVDGSNEQEPVAAYFPGDGLFTPFERRRGLPVGNLTSQWLANLYLTGLDHHLTSGLGVGGYLRYCDDFILLDSDRDRLREILAEAKRYAHGLRLRLHEERARTAPIRAGAKFVGCRVWPTHRLVRKENVRAFRRRVRGMKKGYAAGELTCHDIRSRLVGWLGHARRANSERLIRRLAPEWTFAGGGAENQPCSSRRGLEQ